MIGLTVWQKILTFGLRNSGSTGAPFANACCFLFLFLFLPPVFGQTLRNTVLGSAGDEVATSLALGPGDGSVFAAGMTNSSTAGAQLGWVARIDSLGDVLWQRQIALGTGFTAFVHVTSGADPLRGVLSSSVYHGLPAAYDLQWWVLDVATGDVTGAWPA